MSRLRATLLLAGLALLPAPVHAETPAIHDIGLGPDWTAERRALYYSIDQGSQLIPLPWLEALKQPDGKPFLEGSLARYGFLPKRDPALNHDLPIGFTMAASDRGVQAGISCAACHTRQIEAKGETWRIDGGPAIIDFAGFVRDLDGAARRVHDDKAAFKAFAGAVLGDKATDEGAVGILRAAFDLWWVRYHTFIARSLPQERLWGPARMDAISLIYNRMAGLDVGPPPTYLVPDNIETADAPVRYPFLWNSARQDLTQWTGFAANGNDFFALTRNLGQEYGVFGTFHPQRTEATFSFFNRNYVADNSANFKGLTMAEELVRAMAPPAWPWPVDKALAEKGKAIWERAPTEGGCVACHGMAPGEPRAGGPPTLRTPVVDVGTDRHAWQVVLRNVDTGSLEGASIPGLVRPLDKRDTAIAIIRAGVVGAIVEMEKAAPKVAAQTADITDPKARIHAMATDKLGLSLIFTQAFVKSKLGLGPAPPPRLVVNGYEARVLQGIWAAAPYLHNGSVPTLADLLKPAAERPKSFRVGTAYDVDKVGLAAAQTRFDFTHEVTGCDDLDSGDSNCGHEYGTSLSADEKKALLEYLKVL